MKNRSVVGGVFLKRKRLLEVLDSEEVTLTQCTVTLTQCTGSNSVSDTSSYIKGHTGRDFVLLLSRGGLDTQDCHFLPVKGYF